MFLLPPGYGICVTNHLFVGRLQHDEPITAGGDSTSEVSVSCSSTDDTASVCPSSSSLDGSQGLECSWSPVEGIQTGASVVAGSGVDGGGEAEEAKDRVTEVPRRPSLFRSSIRSLSPLRRHSWGPGKNNGANTEMNQRRYDSRRGQHLLQMKLDDCQTDCHSGPASQKPGRAFSLNVFFLYLYAFLHSSLITNTSKCILDFSFFK